jgi:SYP7 family syntaxin
VNVYKEIENSIAELNTKADEAHREKKKADAAKKNSEIRVQKEQLRKRIPELKELMSKKAKKMSQADLEKRENSIQDIERQIEGIPDGLNKSKFGKDALASQSVSVGGAVATHQRSKSAGKDINISEIEMQTQQNQYSMEHTEQSRQLQSDWEQSKRKQDEGLEYVSQGLGTLTNLASDMGEEIKRQEAMIENLDHKAEQATSEMKTVNMRLKEAITSMRSNRNIIIDIILVVVLLGLGGARKPTLQSGSSIQHA